MEYEIQRYREGDATKLAELFNRVHKRYAGFTPRTEDYWIWCCFQRPDVENDGIIIVEEKQTREIVGYAVLGKSGNVWELCVDTKAPREQIMLIMFEEINGYFRKVNTDRIVINVPSDDRVMQETCRQMGLAEQTPSHMFVGIVDFEALIQALSKKSFERMSVSKEIITVKLLNARPWINPDFSMKIENGKLEILPYLASDGLTVNVDSDIFASLILGKTKPLTAFVKRKLKIRPLRKIFRVLKFLDSIQIDSLWFYPLADFG